VHVVAEFWSEQGLARCARGPFGARGVIWGGPGTLRSGRLIED